MKKACGFYLMADGVSVMAYLQWHTCNGIPAIFSAGNLCRGHPGLDHGYDHRNTAGNIAGSK